MILRRKEGEGRRFGGEYSCHMVECEGCRHMAGIYGHMAEVGRHMAEVRGHMA